MKNVIDKVITILAVLFIVWIVASFFNIGLHNHPFDEDYKDYANWNFFVLFFEGSDTNA